MFGPNGIFSERHRGQWLLACGSSWMLLFVYGTFKFLWLHEWGYACVTAGVIACGPLCVWLTLWHRERREQAAALASAAALERESLAQRAPVPARGAAALPQPVAAPLE